MDNWQQAGSIKEWVCARSTLNSIVSLLFLHQAIDLQADRTGHSAGLECWLRAAALGHGLLLLAADPSLRWAGAVGSGVLP